MFWLNSHHWGANAYIANTYSNKRILQCLRVSHVQVVVTIYSAEKVLK
jgi:hypothetical protein